MTTTTHPTFRLLGADALTGQRQALDTAVRVTRDWTETYVGGLATMADFQRRLVEKTPLAPLADLVTAPAQATRRLVEGYVSAIESLVPAPETVERAGAAATDAVERSGAAVEQVARAQAEAVAGPVEAPIAGYDSLTAGEIITRLPELRQSTLAAVEAYERANQARSTVLDRVAALRGDEPAPGYDELNVGEVQKLLADADEELAKRVASYERRHKGRAGVLQVAERRLEQQS